MITDLHSKSFITLNDLAIAYRNAKIDLYYMGNDSLEVVIDFETAFSENLKLIHKKILDKESLDLGNWSVEPHSIESLETKCKEDNSFIYIDPKKEWVTNKMECSKAVFRIMAQPNMEFHILSSLWIEKVGYKYDEKLGDCSFGNRLRRCKDGSQNLYSIGNFKPYIYQYRIWRDNGLETMHKSLDREKSIVTITADIDSFYHRLDCDFMTDQRFLKIINLDLNDDEIQLTEYFLKALKKWSSETPLGTGLPVGLPASSIIANLALFELDSIIQKELTPLYYGRYVDDLILVLDTQQNEFQSSAAIWDWIVARTKGLLSHERNGSVYYKPNYLHSSQIEFSNEKNKIFIMEGETGKAFLSTLEHQIYQRSSEWRSLPVLPENPDQIGSDLLKATQSDGEQADSLRKANKLTMQRSGLAIKIRDYEAIARDIEPASWRIQREAFFQAVIQHVLVLPVFFHLYRYLGRIIKIAVSCGDYKELALILRRVEVLVDEISKIGEISLKSVNSVSLSSQEIMVKWKKRLKRIINESIAAAIPTRMSQEGMGLWEKYIVQSRLYVNKSFREFQKLQQRLFSSDLAHEPFRHIGFPKEIVRSKGVPYKKNLTFVEDAEALFDSNILKDGLENISRLLKLFKYPNYPAGLVFPTRPLNVSEVFLLYNQPFHNGKSDSIKSVLFASRGFNPDVKFPYFNRKGNLVVEKSGVNREKIKIAVTSLRTKDISWVATIKKCLNPIPPVTLG